MRITILTLFPEMFDGLVNNSIVKRAISRKVVEIKLVNIRDYTTDKYGRVDTPPIGGGAGLIMKCQPVIAAIRDNFSENCKVILMSPRGETYSQKKARSLASENRDLILICGHYEGLDERINNYIDETISVGDYILTGGELASMIVSDSIIRLLDGAIDEHSIEEESFENGLLEYPQYTEPYDFEGYKVPDILYCGNHTAIKKWRQKQSLKLTRKLRKDLFDKYPLTKQDKKLIAELDENNESPDWEQEAISKGRKFMKEKKD